MGAEGEGGRDRDREIERQRGTHVCREERNAKFKRVKSVEC
jgi:hypothetical protein